MCEKCADLPHKDVRLADGNTAPIEDGMVDIISALNEGGFLTVLCSFHHQFVLFDPSVEYLALQKFLKREMPQLWKNSRLIMADFTAIANPNSIETRLLFPDEIDSKPTKTCCLVRK